MTVTNSTDLRIRYIGNGSTDLFAIPAVTGTRTTANSEVYVEVDNELKVLSTDYDITGTDVDFSSYTTPASGAVIDIYLRFPLTQTTNYQTGAALDPEVLESKFDDVWMGVQALTNRTGGTSVQIGNPVLHLGKYTGTGSSGLVVTGVPFRPDILLITENGSNDVYLGVITEDASWPEADGGGNTFNCDMKQMSATGSVSLTDVIQLNTTGFTVNTTDSSINGSTIVYTFIAIKSST